MGFHIIAGSSVVHMALGALKRVAAPWRRNLDAAPNPGIKMPGLDEPNLQPDLSVARDLHVEESLALLRLIGGGGGRSEDRRTPVEGRVQHGGVLGMLVEGGKRGGL